MHAPGPGPDVCVVHVREEKVLFASDLIMPVPVIASHFANIAEYKQSLHNLHEFNLEAIVQGHGDLLLRGEVTSSIEESIQYLNDIESRVERLIEEGAGKTELLSNTIETLRAQPYPSWGAGPKLSPGQSTLPVGEGQGCPAQEAKSRVRACSACRQSLSSMCR